MEKKSIKTILITGGLGLLGKKVAKELVDLGHNVIIGDVKTTGYADITADIISYLSPTTKITSGFNFESFKLSKSTADPSLKPGTFFKLLLRDPTAVLNAEVITTELSLIS